jgi:hypothetical protein
MFCGYLSLPPHPYLLLVLVTPALGAVGLALPVLLAIIVTNLNIIY